MYHNFVSSLYFFLLFEFLKNIEFQYNTKVMRMMLKFQRGPSDLYVYIYIFFFFFFFI